MPAATLTPTTTLTAVQQMEQAMNNVLGTNKYHGTRLIEFDDYENGPCNIQWYIYNDFKFELVTSSTKADVFKMLKAFMMVNLPNKCDIVYLEGFYPKKNYLGNVVETRVVELGYRRDTLQKINWSEFNFRYIYNISEREDLIIDDNFYFDRRFPMVSGY